MKKTISTILALTILTTPLISSTCFANKPKSDARESYVQEPERREQYKFNRLTKSKAAKSIGCVAAGAAAVVGTTVAGLKIFEDLLPEQVKEWLPSWLKKDEEPIDTLSVDKNNDAMSSVEMPEMNVIETVAPNVEISEFEVPETVVAVPAVPYKDISEFEVPETEVAAPSAEVSETVVAVPSVEISNFEAPEIDLDTVSPLSLVDKLLKLDLNMPESDEGKKEFTARLLKSTNDVIKEINEYLVNRQF